MSVRLVEIRRLEDGAMRCEINPDAVTQHREAADIVCVLVGSLAAKWNLSPEAVWRMVAARQEELQWSRIKPRP
jgi:hypothetical protein